MAVINNKTGRVQLTNGKGTIRYTLKAPFPNDAGGVQLVIAAPVGTNKTTTVPGKGTGAKLSWGRPELILGCNLAANTTYTHPSLSDGDTVTVSTKWETHAASNPTVTKTLTEDTSVKTVYGGVVDILVRPTQVSGAVSTDRYRITQTYTHGSVVSTFVRYAYTTTQMGGIPYFTNDMTPYDLPGDGIPCSRNIRWRFATTDTPIPDGTLVKITLSEYTRSIAGGAKIPIGVEQSWNVVVSGGSAFFNKAFEIVNGGISMPYRRVLITAEVPSLGIYTLFATVKNAASTSGG